MAHQHEHDPHTHDHVHEREPAPSGDLTGYAVVKYGLILVITLVVLWFLFNYVLGG